MTKPRSKKGRLLLKGGEALATKGGRKEEEQSTCREANKNLKKWGHNGRSEKKRKKKGVNEKSSGDGCGRKKRTPGRGALLQLLG